MHVIPSSPGPGGGPKKTRNDSPSRYDRGTPSQSVILSERSDRRIWVGAHRKALPRATPQIHSTPAAPGAASAQDDNLER